MKKVVIVVVITLIVGFIFLKVSQINNLLEADTAYNEKKYDVAFSMYEELANKGIIDAQYKLGVMYEKGQGIQQDYKKAIEWFEKVSSDEAAQYALGFIYFKEGMQQDYKKAFEWFEKAANQGNAKAQFNIGNMYHKGYGIEQDSKKAFEWFEKAANQGHQQAQAYLGYMYANGDGVKQDSKKAFEWNGKILMDSFNKNVENSLNQAIKEYKEEQGKN